MSGEQWIEGRRRDGLAVVEGIDGWVIMPGFGGGEVARLPLDRCPCCDERFQRSDVGFRAARLVADLMYPVEAARDAD